MPDPNPQPEQSTDSSAQHIGFSGVLWISAYLLLFAVAIFVALGVIWPVPTPTTVRPVETVAGATNEISGGSLSITNRTTLLYQDPSPVMLFKWQWNMFNETRLLVIVMLAGALGALVHGLRSLGWYVGNRILVGSWMMYYILLPIVGPAIAIVFYFVVRGGFFSPNATFQDTSPFGFAALSSLVGLFSQQAVLKLQQVAETVLTKPPHGTDAKPQSLNSGGEAG